MAQQLYRIRRLDDRTLFDILKRGRDAAEVAASAEGLGGENVSAQIACMGPPIVGVLNFDDEGPISGKYTITSANLTLKTAKQTKPQSSKTFTIRRGQEGELDTLEFPQQASGNDEGVWRDGRAQAALFAAYEALTDALAPTVNDLGTEVGQLTNFAANIDTSFRSFTQGLETALQTLADQRAAEQAHNEKVRERLHKENEEERDRLLQAAQEQIDAKTATLNEREKELNSREDELEIKSHKDARRQLFKSMQDDLQNRKKSPSASLSVFAARWMIFLTLCGAGGVAAWFALSSMTPDSLPEGATTLQIWTVILKPIGLSALALGSFAAAVQWLRHFYTQDLRDAVDVQRFGHDMARASWVMEAYLEMTKEHGVDEVPDSWMRNVTEGMFQADRGSHGVDEASQALAALLGMSATVKAGPNGLEATLGKRGLRKIAQATQDGED